MTNCIILVDNSNIYIEGGKFSARKKGAKKNNPEDREPWDPSWRLDFSSLLEQLAVGRNVSSAILVGSEPPPNDKVWESAERGGFKVITHERDSSGKEKAVDTELVAVGTELVCTTRPQGVLIIASGDRDFLPLVKAAHRQGWETEMCTFSSSFSPYGDMATSVTRVRQLDGVFDRIGRYEFEWSV